MGIFMFSSFKQMSDKSDQLKKGDKAITQGYRVFGDGGGAEYDIVDYSEGKDDFFYPKLASGKKIMAKIKIVDGRININQLGAVADAVIDDGICRKNDIDFFEAFRKDESFCEGIINNATDNFMYIEAALNHPEVKIAELGSGCYYIGDKTVRIPSGKTLDGKGATVVSFAAFNGCECVFEIKDAKNTEIKNIKAERCFSDLCKIPCVKVENSQNIRIDNLEFSTAQLPLYIKNSKEVNITRIRCTDCEGGIKIDSSSNLRLKRCEFLKDSLCHSETSTEIDFAVELTGDVSDINFNDINFVSDLCSGAICCRTENAGIKKNRNINFKNISVKNAGIVFSLGETSGISVADFTAENSLYFLVMYDLFDSSFSNVSFYSPFDVGNVGVIVTDDTGVNGNISFKDCIFSVTDKWFNIPSDRSCEGDSWSFERCVFRANKTADSKKHGIPAYIEGIVSYAEFTECDFEISLKDFEKNLVSEELIVNNSVIFFFDSSNRKQMYWKYTRCNFINASGIQAVSPIASNSKNDSNGSVRIDVTESRFKGFRWIVRISELCETHNTVLNPAFSGQVSKSMKATAVNLMNSSGRFLSSGNTVQNNYGEWEELEKYGTGERQNETEKGAVKSIFCSLL